VDLAGGGPTAIFIPFAIALIAHAAVFAIWIARQKVNDDAIRALWQQMAEIWARDPEVHDLVMSGRPIDVEELNRASAQTRADISTVMQLSDALGGLAGRFGSDRSTLFSLWPVQLMWTSLQPVVDDARSRNPIAYRHFERALTLYNRYTDRAAAEMRGESNVVLVTVAVGIAVLIYALDQTVVATALPRITTELQGINLYGWVFSAYTISATATTLLFGRLGDLTNRRRLFVIAMSGFLVGSILCGLAPNMPLLVAFRAVQGLFGGATFPLAIGIIADTYPIERRAQGFVIIPTTYAIASVMGPLVGGFVTQNIGWRAIFFINIPIVTTAIFLLTASYRAPARHGRLRLQDLDPPGVITLFGGLVTLLIGLTTGNQDWDWFSWEEIVMLVGGVSMLIAFGYIELHTEKPLLPLRILKHRGLGGALLTIALVAWVANSMIVFMPEYVQAGLSADTQGAGLVLIPLLFTWAATANIAVRIGQKRGFRNVAWFGVPPIIAGLVYLYFMHFGYESWTVTPGLALIGLGAGLINPNMLVLAQSSLSDRDQSMAGGLGNVAQSLSAAVAAASLTALQINRLDSYAGLSSVANASWLITPFGRVQWSGLFGQNFAAQAQRWMTLSIHDAFVVAFVPAILLGFWLWRVVLPSNAAVRENRLPPLREAAAAAPAAKH
jgi:EmrB/QacA subfamily drug resistance transporter